MSLKFSVIPLSIFVSKSRKINDDYDFLLVEDTYNVGFLEPNIFLSFTGSIKVLVNEIRNRLTDTFDIQYDLITSNTTNITFETLKNLVFINDANYSYKFDTQIYDRKVIVSSEDIPSIILPSPFNSDVSIKVLNTVIVRVFNLLNV